MWPPRATQRRRGGRWSAPHGRPPASRAAHMGADHRRASRRRTRARARRGSLRGVRDEVAMVPAAPRACRYPQRFLHTRGPSGARTHFPGPWGGPQPSGPENKVPELRLKLLIWLASPAGFEPTAPRLGIWCSIRLSYGDISASSTTAPRQVARGQNSGRAAGAQGGGEGALIQHVQCAAHRHALRQAGDRNAERA